VKPSRTGGCRHCWIVSLLKPWITGVTLDCGESSIGFTIELRESFIGFTIELRGEEFAEIK
jgi:hypothetical protein